MGRGYLSDKLAPPPLPLLSIDDDRYAALWEQSPQRSPFSHPAVAHAIADAFGLGLSGAAVVNRDGGIEAAVPVLVKRWGPWKASALPPLCPVHAPLLAAPLAEAETHAHRSPLDLLLTDVVSSYDQITFALPPTLSDLRPFTWAGWKVKPRYTYVLSLGHRTDAAFSSATRRTVRKEAPTFEIAEDVTYATAAVRLMIEGYARHGESLGLDQRAIVRLAQVVVDMGLARVFAALRDGTLEAAVVVATDQKTAYYWIAGSVPGPAMTVLLSAVLLRLGSEGVELFDFCGANTPSIAEFKRRFGPSLSPAPVVQAISHPALRLLSRFRP